MGSGDVAFPRLGETKQRILALLRRRPRTIPELAAELGLSPNAVRLHLVALERDGLVAPCGWRPTARRPAATYAPTLAADQLLPKPYAAVLSKLLQTIRDEHGSDGLIRLLGEVGEHLGREQAPRVAGLADRARVEAIAGVLTDLGGIVEVEERNGGWLLVGYSCPLAAVAVDHAEVCTLARVLIATLLGRDTVRACCERGSKPRCRFAIERTGPEQDARTG
jgi:predicted ArsR family transcriptional regulator